VCFLDEQLCERENSEGWRRLIADKKPGSKREKMARSLAEFVKDKYVPGTDAVTFNQRTELPIGFEVICISSQTLPWHSGESGNLELLDPQELAAMIGKNNELLSKYREKVADSPIWLLIASGPSISRGVPIPLGADEWRFSFDFDKVLLFSGMDNRVFEIGRATII